MQKPNLDRLWQVWIKIGVPQGSYEDWFKQVTDTIKSQVAGVVSVLETKKMIDWYYFLIHHKEGNNLNLYFHLIFSLGEDIESEDFLGSLPSYCLDPKHLDRGYGESISGIEKALLKDNKIEEAWRIIGKQSEWIIDLIRIYKDGKMTIQQFVHFMHFYTNAMGLGHQSKLSIPPYTSF
jgi:hypothetical protein